MLADGAHQTTASTGPGQKSHVERRKGERFHRWKRRTSQRKPGWLVRVAHIERGHGLPVVRNERKAGICSGLSFDEASARRSWRANRGALAGIRCATGAPLLLIGVV